VIETEEQLDLIEKLECDNVQGYLLGKPMLRDDYRELIRMYVKAFPVGGDGVTFDSSAIPKMPTA
jgi:predicted signal transduction protein with EAL and GGDEF domain